MVRKTIAKTEKTKPPKDTSSLKIVGSLEDLLAKQVINRLTLNSGRFIDFGDSQF